MPSIRAAQASNNGAGGTSITMTKPTGTVDGDVMVMSVTALGGTGTTISVPSIWTSQSNPWSASGACWCMATDGSRIVAGGTGPIVATSDNGGDSWTSRTNPFASGVSSMAYGNSLYVGIAGTSLATSSDGATWGTLQTSVMGGSSPMAAAYGGGKWVIVGTDGKIYSSTTAGSGTWSSQTSPFGTAQIDGLAYGNGYFVASTAGAKLAARSSDGDAWSSAYTLPIESGGQVCYGGGIWVIGATHSRWAWSSDDGVTWYAASDAGVLAANIAEVIYATDSGGRSRFLAVSSGDYMQSSVDGKSWLSYPVDSTISGGSLRTVTQASGKCAVGGSITNGLIGNTSDPFGWLSVGAPRTSGTSIKQSHFWKIANSEPASYAVGVSPTNQASGVIVSVDGAAWKEPSTTMYASQTSGSSTSIVAPTLGSWSSSSGFDVGLFGLITASSITPPTDYTEPSNADSASSGTTSQASYRALTSVTTVGSITATGANAAINAGFHVFLPNNNQFEVSLPLQSVEVEQQGQSTVDVTPEIMSGSAESVTMSSANVPTGVTLSYDPNPVTAGNTTVVTVSADLTSVEGDQDVSVIGTATSWTNTKTLKVKKRNKPDPVRVFPPSAL